MKVVGNYELGWKGFAFKVMTVSELTQTQPDTLALDSVAQAVL